MPELIWWEFYAYGATRTIFSFFIQEYREPIEGTITNAASLDYSMKQWLQPNRYAICFRYSNDLQKRDPTFQGTRWLTGKPVGSGRIRLYSQIPLPFDSRFDKILQ